MGRQLATNRSPSGIPACASSLALHPFLSLLKTCSLPPSSIKAFSASWNRASRQEMRSWTWSSWSWKELRPWWLFCTQVARINLQVQQAWDEQTAKQWDEQTVKESKICYCWDFVSSEDVDCGIIKDFLSTHLTFALAVKMTLLSFENQIFVFSLKPQFSTSNNLLSEKGVWWCSKAAVDGAPCDGSVIKLDILYPVN